MVFSKLILRFTVSKEGKILEPKKAQAIMNMLVPINPQQIQIFNGIVQELCLYHGTNHKDDEEDKTFYPNHKVLRSLGSVQAKIHKNTNFDSSKFTIHVHTYASLLTIGAMLAQIPIGKYDKPIVYVSRLLNKTMCNIMVFQCVSMWVV